MSASDKKRLRKEQNAAAMTEKQKQAQKEAKKLKIYTLSFVVAMVLIVAIILGIVLWQPIAGVIDRNTTAIKVGTHELSTTEFSYYYSDAINTYVNQFSDYGDYATLYMQMMGLDPSKALDEQVYDQSAGTTWADFFIDQAKTTAQLNYALYDDAVKNGFELPEDDAQSVDTLGDTLEVYAAYYGYSSVDSYLRNVYGDGATLKTYKEYYRINLLASAYAEDHHDSLVYEEADFRAFEKGKEQEYNSYSYALHKLTVDDYLKFLGLGTTTKDEDGKETTTYSDEDKAKAKEAMLADAKLLTAAENNTVALLNVAINALAINAPETTDTEAADGDEATGTEETTDGEEATDTEETTDTKETTESTGKNLIEATEAKNVLYATVKSNTNEDVQKWLSDTARKEGDVTYVEITTGTDDKKTTTGCYIVMYLGTNDNTYFPADVQHILVKFEGGTKDSSGNTTYSQAEKDATKAKAQAILDEFLKGEKKDSDAFGALAKTKSEDTGSKDSGGLIAGIHNDAGYVVPFTEWALAEHKTGDTGLVETEYGWHVMFFKGLAERNYRDTMINDDKVAEEYEKWEKSLTDAVAVTSVNLKGIKTDFVISG